MLMLILMLILKIRMLKWMRMCAVYMGGPCAVAADDAVASRDRGAVAIAMMPPRSWRSFEVHF